MAKVVIDALDLAASNRPRAPTSFHAGVPVPPRPGRRADSAEAAARRPPRPLRRAGGVARRPGGHQLQAVIDAGPGDRRFFGFQADHDSGPGLPAADTRFVDQRYQAASLTADRPSSGLRHLRHRRRAGRVRGAGWFRHGLRPAHRRPAVARRRRRPVSRPRRGHRRGRPRRQPRREDKALEAWDRHDPRRPRGRRSTRWAPGGCSSCPTTPRRSASSCRTHTHGPGALPPGRLGGQRDRRHLHRAGNRRLRGCPRPRPHGPPRRLTLRRRPATDRALCGPVLSQAPRPGDRSRRPATDRALLGSILSQAASASAVRGARHRARRRGRRHRGRGCSRRCARRTPAGPRGARARCRRRSWPRRAHGRWIARSRWA